MPPDDRTIVEGAVPEGEGVSGGTPGDGSTIIEGVSADSSTIIEGTQARAEAGFNLVPGGQFQGHTLLKPLQVTSGEADLWFIADQKGKEHVLKLYRYGIKPKEEITKKIRSLGYEHVVTIEESGEVSGRHFEILEKIEHGDLDEYAGDKPLEEEQLKVVVEELGSAVAHLHKAGIIHRDIKPANILVRTLEPLDLVMTDFGISSISDVSLHMTSVNRTALYSAPEAINGVVARGSDWWCVGIIFLKLLLGKHPLEGMTEQAITFQLVTKGVKVPEEIGQDWQLLLKGLLTRDPDNRWAWKEVEQWLGGKRDIATQYEGDQKEEKRYDYKPYKLRGREIYEPKDLAVYLGENWSEGVKQFGRGYITKWVENDFSDQGLASDLTDITEDEGLDGDEKLSAGLMVMATDLPMFWKGEVVSRDWLVGNPEATVKISQSKLLDYYDLHRSEDELKLGEIAGRVKEMAGDEGLQGEERDLVVTLAVNPEHPLKLGEELIDSQEWMAANPEEAMKILKGPLPVWQERLTGKKSLIEARDGCKAWSDAVLALGVPVDENRVDELILQSEEERESRFKVFWQKFESGEYVGAKDKKLQALLDKGEVGQVEQLILLAVRESEFLNPQEKYELDSMAHLKGFGVEMDWGLAGKLIDSKSWEEINPLWQEVLGNPLPATLKGNERISSITNSQQAEFLDVVALVSASKIAERQEAGVSIENGKYWRIENLFKYEECTPAQKMITQFGPLGGELVHLPHRWKWAYSGVDPRNIVQIEYTNFQGEHQFYDAIQSSLRTVNAHLSFYVSLEKGRITLLKERIINFGKLSAIPSKQDHTKIIRHLRRGTSNPEYEILRRQFPVYAPLLPTPAEKRVITFHQRRGSTSARYEAVKAKYSLQELPQTQVDLDRVQPEDGAGVEIHRDLITNSLLVLILERGLADEQDLEVIQGEHNLSGESVAALLAKAGFLDVPSQLELIAEYLGTDVIDISRIDFTEDLVSLIPLDMAKQHQCVPIGLDGEVIHLSMVDPLNPTVLDELAFQLNHPLQVRVADPNQILHILEEKYSGEATFDD